MKHQALARHCLAPVPTFTATIYCGLKEGYAGAVHDFAEAESICQTYCNAVKLGLFLTQGRFVYVDGAEDGLACLLVNYPRFPSTPDIIRGHARTLAGILGDRFRQLRVSIVFPDVTETLEA